MSRLKQKILEGIRISGLSDWALTVDDDCYGIVSYERLTDEDIDELATCIFDEINKQPTLNDNQQIVLEYLKKMCPPKLGVSAMVTVYCFVDDNINDNWQEYSEKIPGYIEALQKLTIAEENQVLQEFGKWVEKQEEE